MGGIEEQWGGGAEVDEVGYGMLRVSVTDGHKVDVLMLTAAWRSQLMAPVMDEMRCFWKIIPATNAEQRERDQAQAVAPAYMTCRQHQHN